MGNTLSIPMGHLPAGINWQSAGVAKDTQDVRQQRVRELIEKEFGGSQAAFAKAVDRSDNYISRMLSRGPNRKGIGEDLAREIEKLCNKPRGWLDGEADAVRDAPSTLYGQPITERAAATGREWDKLAEPVKSQLAALIEMLVAQQVRDQRQVERKRSKRQGAGAQQRVA